MLTRTRSHANASGIDSMTARDADSDGDGDRRNSNGSPPPPASTTPTEALFCPRPSPTESVTFDQNSTTTEPLIIHGDTHDVSKATGVSHGPIEICHPFRAPLTVSERLKKGMSAEDLFACLDADKDGRIHLEDLQAFMLNVSVSVGASAVDGRDNSDPCLDQDQIKVGVFPQRAVSAGLEETDNSTSVKKSKHIVLGVDGTKDGLTLIGKGTASDHKTPVSHVSRGKQATGTTMTMIDQYNHRIQMKLAKAEGKTYTRKPSHTDERDIKKDGRSAKQETTLQSKAKGFGSSKTAAQLEHLLRRKMDEAKPTTALGRDTKAEPPQEEGTAYTRKTSDTEETENEENKVAFQSKALISSKTPRLKIKSNATAAQFEQPTRKKVEEDAKTSAIRTNIDTMSTEDDANANPSESKVLGDSLARVVKKRILVDKFAQRMKAKLDKENGGRAVTNSVTNRSVAGVSTNNIAHGEIEILDSTTSKQKLEQFEQRATARLKRGREGEVTKDNENQVAQMETEEKPFGNGIAYAQDMPAINDENVGIRTHGCGDINFGGCKTPRLNRSAVQFEQLLRKKMEDAKPTTALVQDAKVELSQEEDTAHARRTSHTNEMGKEEEETTAKSKAALQSKVLSSSKIPIVKRNATAAQLTRKSLEEDAKTSATRTGIYKKIKCEDDANIKPPQAKVSGGSLDRVVKNRILMDKFAQRIKAKLDKEKGGSVVTDSPTNRSVAGASVNNIAHGEIAIADSTTSKQKVEQFEQRVKAKLEKECKGQVTKDNENEAGQLKTNGKPFGDGVAYAQDLPTINNDDMAMRTRGCGDLTNLIESVDDELGISNEHDINDYMGLTATSERARVTVKQSRREALITGDDEVGAVQIDEQAPHINRRFYLGLNRASALKRRLRRREARRRRGRDADEDGEARLHQRDRSRNSSLAERASGLFRPRSGVESGRVDEEAQENTDNRGVQESQTDQEPHNIQRRTATERLTGGWSHGFFANISDRHLVTAHLVEEEEIHLGEVVVAERVGVFEKKWKSFACSTCFLLVILAVLPAVLLPVLSNGGAKDLYTLEHVPSMQPSSTPSSIPSMQPSTSPSFDPRPTLELVQARGHVRCLLSQTDVDAPSGKERIELCRSIAAVLFGNPENYRASTSKWSDSFGQLNSRNVDVIIRSVTHTVEREVRETSTGVGFSFSSPYYYDGMAYFGNETFVRCAEEQIRYSECSSLRICVYGFTTSFDFVQSSFPSNFLKVFSPEQADELMEMVWNGRCVRAQDRSLLLPYASSDRNSNKGFIVGDKLMTKEPHAIVTRNNDREFSDIINWVVHALYYGQEQGMTHSSSLCQSYANLTSTVPDLNFLNAVHCVGDLGQVMSNLVQYSNNMKKINNGTTGMLYATPFGELGHAHDDIANGGLLDGIRNDQGSLKCGVVVPDGDTRYNAESDQLVGMNIDYCHTIAAALFDGNSKAVTLLNFPDTDSSSFDALNNGTIDVLAGARVELKYDFQSSPSLGGFQFSTPYYYRNETARDYVSSFSLATREDDILFSSFVNTIILSTLHAQEIGLTKKRSADMPSMSIFGSEFNWALRDAISYSGSYAEMYSKNFGDVVEENRGLNALNKNGDPQSYSFPGLNPVN